MQDTHPGLFCILMFCGLFFRLNSLPFLNHLNLREEYSELVSHRSTSLEPATDSWLFISFKRGGKAKREKRRKKVLITWLSSQEKHVHFGEPDQEALLTEREKKKGKGVSVKMYLSLETNKNAQIKYIQGEKENLGYKIILWNRHTDIKKKLAVTSGEREVERGNICADD